MIDNDRAGAALCLRALPRIIDDKRRKVGQRAPERVGVAGRVKRSGFAGQPLQVAMLAIVDERVGAKLVFDPQIGRQIGMRRHKVRIMVASRLVQMIAARGLQQDSNVTQHQNRQMKAIRAHTFGGPEVVQLDDVDDPQPGPGEVLVDVRAAGVNPADTQ